MNFLRSSFLLRTALEGDGSACPALYSCSGALLSLPCTEGEAPSCRRASSMHSADLELQPLKPSNRIRHECIVPSSCWCFTRCGFSMPICSYRNGQSWCPSAACSTASKRTNSSSASATSLLFQFPCDGSYGGLVLCATGSYGDGTSWPFFPSTGSRRLPSFLTTPRTGTKRRRLA